MSSNFRQNISLGENIGNAYLYRDCRHQICGISNGVGENETRKNPEQTFERIYSKSPFTINYNCGFNRKVYETYCRLIKADSVQFHHINSTFSISHASTIVENGSAFFHILIDSISVKCN
ncbi:MAG TPA: hypothetical protein DCR43_09850 [Bacteroidales bacterium]|nr:MAG: hypothetical protein A2X11_03565 [Bacteroidetes bacterium GWE2_42_24]OFY32698.1 MAG: hypothetical protein A2X09_06555 [Bacteroidetes bacterium GWF2_43_11]HAQ66138.1 hypothetical protein [Bacteroidales bacterium]HBZ65222.1 hypothetical protein [Bacteroidales bacterium]